MKKFVVLWHEIGPSDTLERGSHFDLMIDCGVSLRTWALERWPPDVQRPSRVLRLPDHRPAYLTYEGPISGNRGTVRRVDAGTCQVMIDAANETLLRIVSPRFDGSLTIVDGWVTAST
jgi:hypothetical protein